MCWGSGRLGWAVALAAAACTAAPTAGSAQVVDSVAIRIRESLHRLGRPPAPDTAALPDSLTATEIRAVPRPGAPPRASNDTVITALSALAGYDATQYSGTAADYDAATHVLILHGDSASRASVLRQGTELTADSLIRYDQTEGRIRGEGNPLFRAPEGDPVQSQRVIYDIAGERGSAFGARTRYSEGATWYVAGDLPSVTPGVVYGSHTDFTSCELTVPHYHFSAEHIKIIAGRILVARPVKLYFADVPVAWLPFFAQSLGSGRASGLLTPRFSVNDIVRTSTGYHRRVSNVGFYWALSDYADATVALDWFSGNFTSLTGSLRYSWLRQFLNGSVNVRQYWREDGGNETAMDSNTSWQMDERTSLRGSVRFVTSADFIQRNSFDPVEVTQSINSSGGFDRRFGWGSAQLSGTRDQFLTNGRVTMTLPQLSVNLSPITLFRAPLLRSSFYNNMTWSAHLNGQRATTDEPDTTLLGAINKAYDQRTLQGDASSTLSMGNLSWSQRMGLNEGTRFRVPFGTATGSVIGLSPTGRALVTSDAAAAIVDPVRDEIQSTLTWSTGLGYQQKLVGSTTLTPQLSLSGQARRSNTLPDSLGVAPDRFVSAPSRLTFGASLKSDLFGFFPGFGPFEMIRHKISPGIDFSYQPAAQTSTALQQAVFGRQAIQPRKELTFSFNQTFEAKREVNPDSAAAIAQRAAAPPTLGPQPLQPADSVGGLVAGGLSASGLRRVQRPTIVTLLALNTTAVQYDFVEADTAGSFLWGFRTTRISNQIRSDFLQGLSISMSHDLFADTTIGTRRERRFDLHLSDLNLGFSLSNRSAIFRAIGLFRSPASDTAVAPPPQPTPTPLTPENPFLQTTSATDERSIIPRSDVRPGEQQEQRPAAEVGSWNATFTYSMVRPRVGTSASTQSLNAVVTFKPTALWDLSWRTSYDLVLGTFVDHSIGLSRDIHDWEARFDFMQTATGNWMFRFNVSLKANRDFKFDYDQRSDVTAPLR